MEGKGRRDRRVHLVLLLLPSLLAQTLFLWMFFSAARIEQTVRLGSCSHARGVRDDADRRARLEFLADRFAAQWRHGMAGNSPLYMPGFFALGVTTWLWSIGRPLRRLGGEALLIALIATPGGALLSRFSGDRAVQSFEMASGYYCTLCRNGFQHLRIRPQGIWLKFRNGCPAAAVRRTVTPVSSTSVWTHSASFIRALTSPPPVTSCVGASRT